jgi:Holliday junction DNA helicase RuvA
LEDDIITLMIKLLTGNIVHTDLNHLVLEVGGVGYKVFSSPNTLSNTNRKVPITLWIHTAVRENSIDLYGFIKKEELDFYELLLTVSGIGPKTALGILTVASVENLKRAIQTEDTSHLIKISGIGKKNAEKIVLELKGKAGSEESGGRHTEDMDVLEALLALGFDQKASREALKKISKNTETVNDRIKEAIKFLGQ